MPRPSRIRVAAAVLAVLAAAPLARAAEPDKLLPADSDTVIQINVRQVLDSEIIKKYALGQIKDFLKGGDAQQALRELGLDPLTDIQKITIGGSGKDPTDVKGLIIVRGKFDPDKLFRAAEAQSKKDPDKFAMIKDGKDVMFKIQPDTGNPMYATVVDESTIVLGTEKKMITTALAAATGDKKPALNKDLAVLVGRMDEKASVWIVAMTKGKLDELKIPGGAGGPGAEFQKHLPNLESVSMTVRVTADIALDVGLGMKDDQSATDFLATIDDGLSQLKGLLAFAAADPKVKPLADVVRGIKTGAKGKAVTLTAKMPGDAIGKMINPGD